MILPNLSLVFASIGAAVSQSQGPIKPIRIEEPSKSGAKNNEGIGLYLQGDLKGALKLFDEASLLDMGDPVPWINGAIANYDLGKFSVSSRAKSQAWLMGGRSIRVITVGAELDTARGQLSKAWSAIQEGEFQSPEDPYLHIARAKYADAIGALRVAERSRWQAYRLGQLPVVDSKPFDGTGLGFGAGIVEAGYLSARTRQVSAGQAGVGSLALLTEELGGDAKARQSLLHADFASASRMGTLMGGYRRLLGDRPGTLDSMSLFPSTPGARLEFDYLTAGWQKSWSPWTANVSFREASVDLRPDAASPMSRNNFQNQWTAEARYDSGSWTAGAGLSDVYRRSVANPVLEPLEEVFGQGRTRLGHAYAVFRHSPMQSIRLVSGAALNWVDDSTVGLLSGEAAVKIAGNRYLKLGAKPSMNRVGSNLYPEDLRARSRPASRQPQGQQPLLSPTGRQLDTYAILPIVSNSRADVQLKAYRREMTNAFFSSGDPDQASSMNLTFVDRLRVAGTSLTALWMPSTDLEVFASAAAQSSSAYYPVPRRTGDAPNVPKLVAAVGASTGFKDWNVSVQALYTGPRIQAATSGNAGIPQTQFRRVPGVWTIDAFASRPVGEGFLTLSARNISRSSLYPGFGISSSYMLSYQQRY